MHDQTTAPAIADEATIRAQIAEALAANPVLTLVRAAAPIRTVPAEIGESLRDWYLSQPPFLLLYVATMADVDAWAAHLGYEVETKVTPLDDCLERKHSARGSWLGWTVVVALERTDYLPVVNVRAAALRDLMRVA